MPAICPHCGSAFEAVDGAEFCSPGCAAVHARIVGGGLDRFYTLRGKRVAPVGSEALQPSDYTWLTEAVQAAEAGGKPTAQLTLDVQGIACVGCVWLIERLFLRCPGALRIDINVAHGRLYWHWESGRFPAAALARELQDFGYVVGRAGAKPQWGESRSLRLRLGLCAAFAMNTMLFVLPSYLGLERTSEFHPLFEKLAALFATAAFFTGGGYFAKRAWAGLRHGLMNLDLPITLGLGIGYAGSLAGWIAGNASFVYFDFVSVFSFLMLVGRWTQEVAVERNRHQLLALGREPAEVMVEREPAAATPGGAEAPSAAVRSPVAALQRGVRFSVGAGQVVPVDATLVSAAATFTTEWINGEPEPRDLRAGQLVPAGATSVSLGPVRLQALEGWAESSLSRLLEVSGAHGFRHVFVERIIRIYLAAIIALAAAGGAGWWWLGGDGLKALQVAMAVLVASCPCGLGVAFPLVEELAVAALRRRGVFVRELSVFPRLRRIRKIIFDKTGTLTLETPVLCQPERLAALDATARERLGQLVQRNPHPVARAVHEALVLHRPPELKRASLPSTEADARGAAAHEVEITEIVGQGVRLRVGDGEWTLGRVGFAKELAADWGGLPILPPISIPSVDPRPETGRVGPADAEFRHDGRLLLRLQFVEAARADARHELGALQAQGRAVYVLSGDRTEKVESLAAALGIPPAQALGGLSPGAKRDWVRSHDAGDTLMLGDGANDSLAFDAASARGTPVVHRGVLGAKSDFYYLGRGLRGLRYLWTVAELRRRTVRAVFAFTLLYNVGTLLAALSGRMNPLVAAVAMPISSLLSLALASGGMRRAFRE